MKTKEEINKKIEELKKKECVYLAQGGGGLQNPYPYDDLIKLLEWVMK